MTIELDHIDVCYGATQVLRDITHTFSPGVTALVGRNGAGKSTLLRTICGILQPSSGKLYVDGLQWKGSSAESKSIRTKLAWMPQHAALPLRSRVIDLVRYAAWLRLIPKQDIPHNVDKVLTAVSLHDVAARRLGTLSGGQQRRVSLACVLIGTPQIMLLDEPTVGLDPEQRDEFLRVVKDFGASGTVLLSTHLMEDVLGTADHMVVMASGTVQRTHDVDKLLGALDQGNSMDALTTLRKAVLSEDHDSII